MAVEVLIVVLGTAEAEFSEPALCYLPELPDVGDWIHFARTKRLPGSDAAVSAPSDARLEVRRRHFSSARSWVQLDCVLLNDGAEHVVFAAEWERREGE